MYNKRFKFRSMCISEITNQPNYTNYKPDNSLVRMLIITNLEISCYAIFH